MEAITRFRDLTRLDLDNDFIVRMAATIGGDLDTPLTAFQSKAMQALPPDPSRTNVLVAGPTTAGKTLVATVAAEKVFRETSRRLIYAVPLKAMVTEKAYQLRKIFPGARVISVSADYPRGDHYIGADEWDVAVVVLDKLYQWLADAARAKQVVERLGLVVVDELQLLAEEDRGEKLEITLTLLRMTQTRSSTCLFGLMGLGISRQAALQLASWLDAQVIPAEETERPVPLYHAIVNREGGAAIYSEGLYGVSPCSQMPLALASLFEPPVPGTPDAFACRAVEQGLRVIVYCATQAGMRDCADAMRRALPRILLRSDVLERLSDLEESPSVERLRELFQYGIGIHARFLSQYERSLTEDLFRDAAKDAAVKVIVATRTLGMGVNLPADVIVFRDLSAGQRTNGGTRSSTRPLTVSEYHNFAGRVGRLKVGATRLGCGVAACFPRDDGQSAERLITGSTPPIGSSLGSMRFGPARHILVSLGFQEAIYRSVRPADAITAVLSQSLIPCGAKSHEEDVRGRFNAELGELCAERFVVDNGLSGIGRGVARYGLSRTGAGHTVAIAKNIRVWWPHGKLSLLMQICKIPDFHFLERGGHESNKRRRFQELYCYMHEFLGHRYGLIDSPHVENWLSATTKSARFKAYEAVAERGNDLDLLIKAVVVLQWAAGVPLKRLNDFKSPALQSDQQGPPSQRRDRQLFPHDVVNLAEVGNAAEMAHSLIGAVRTIYGQLPSEHSTDSVTQVQEQLWCWEQSIRYGVPLNAVPIAVTLACACDERLPRKSLLGLYTATGETADVRPWRGKQCPAGANARSWNALQAGLEWWHSEVHAWLGSDTPPGFIARALESLASGSSQRVVAGPRDAPWNTAGAVSRLSPSAGSRHLETDRLAGLADVCVEVDRVVRREYRHHEVMELLLQRDLAKQPLAAQWRVLRRSREWRLPRWELRVNAATALVALHVGDIAAKDLTHACEPGATPFVVIVTGTISDDVATPPKGCSCLVSASALVAACRWVQHRPEFRRRLVSVLTGDAGVFRTAKQVLGVD